MGPNETIPAPPPSRPPDRDRPDHVSAEIIRPKKMTLDHRSGDDRTSGRYGLVFGVAVVALVAVVAVSGVLLLRYLKQHPVVIGRPPAPSTAVPQPPDRTVDPAPAAPATAAVGKAPVSPADPVTPSLQQTMEEGRSALAAGDVETAREKYAAALTMAPGDPDAQQGLARVKSRETVLERVASGRTHEDNEDWPSARADYEAALEKSDRATRQAEIKKLRPQAEKAESAEDWTQALSLYTRLNQLDPDAGFAREGRARAMKQMDLAARIDRYLENPGALAAEPQLQDAVNLLDEAGRTVPMGRGLAERRQRLGVLVRDVREPVKVTIESDNLTEIAVYKVGKLGRLTVRELDLRPDRYTVVGSRDGYQDVRRNITVKPGQGPIRLKIICQKKI